MADAQGSTLLLGMLRRTSGADDAEAFQNILVALTDEPQIYVKRHLVPFGEYYPVPDFIREWMRLMNLPYTRRDAGADDQPPLDVAGERARDHDLLRGRVRRRAAALLAGSDAARQRQQRRVVRRFDRAAQHLQIARVRAAEAGRYLLRAANTGITAVIDPHGRHRRHAAAVRARAC